MNKFLLTIAALAAISGSALADRNNDLRDSDTYIGKYSSNINLSGASGQALAVIAADNEMAVELRRIDEKNEMNG